jgi:hypothetical protein
MDPDNDNEHWLQLCKRAAQEHDLHPVHRSADTLLFDVEVNLCGGTVLRDLFAIQFHL